MNDLRHRLLRAFDVREAQVLPMLHIEKALFLKSIGLFSAIPDDALLEPTAALKEVALPAGETLFWRGGVGTSMYLIAQGRVRIQDGDRELVTLDTQRMGERVELARGVIGFLCASVRAKN